MRQCEKISAASNKPLFFFLVDSFSSMMSGLKGLDLTTLELLQSVLFSQNAAWNALHFLFQTTTPRFCLKRGRLRVHRRR